MKILFFNESSLIKGGIDAVISFEIEGLVAKGIEVRLIEIKHKDILDKSILKKADLFFNKKKKINFLKNQLLLFQPDIIHIHNTYPFYRENLWAYEIFDNYKKVFHLHNFYPICLNSFCYINNQICNRCMIYNNYLPAIKSACYDNSIFKTYFASINRAKPQMWLSNSSKADCYIAVSEFIKQKYLEFGVDRSRIIELPNGFGNADSVNYDSNGSYILFLGNIVLSKGVEIVCKLALMNPAIKFVIAGTGRDIGYIKTKYPNLCNVEYTGYVENDAKVNLIKKSKLLLFPTQSWEAFGLVILESLYYGKPVVTSGIGATSELVINEINGIVVKSNLLDDYNNAINKIWNNELHFINSKWQIHLEKYSIENHINGLINLYNNLLSN